MVIESHAIPYPLAVVVHHEEAGAALRAVVCSFGPYFFAYEAELVLVLFVVMGFIVLSNFCVIDNLQKVLFFSVSKEFDIEYIISTPISVDPAWIRDNSLIVVQIDHNIVSVE